MNYSPTGQIAHRFLRTAHGDVVSTNERWVLRQIWLHPGISRSEITSRSDLAQQSIHRILDHLGERGVISFGEPKSGLGRGQPSPMLSLNGSHAYSCGISVNTDVMGICLMSLAGEVLGQASLSLHGQPVEEALAEAEEKIANLRRARELDPERCFGIGLGIAGYYVGGTRYNASLPLHEWSLIELGPLLSNLFGMPVWVHNGGSTGAVAEALFGIGRHIRNFAYLSFNYGFGGGIVSDGELLVGGNGNAGEYGPIFRGGVARPALQFLIERLRDRGIEIHSIMQLQREFNPDWPGVDEWVDEVAPAYNRLVDAIIGVFDPQAIVFGGQVPPALAQMFITRTAAPEPARYGVPRPVAKLIVSEIAGDAQALGAAAVPFKSEFF
ncbi:ROK family transcriptional regulator [Mesorhizobium sp. M0047]|uniref:ROK family transcriptional regulator n=1 Tax=Mesorhizobium sp. M0047 TaxID=2956859 RepID=UPI0033396672